MMWINLNTDRDPDWLEYVSNTRGVEGVLQTYIIRNDPDYSRTDAANWWKFQSNVHGVVMAIMEVPKATIDEYPRTVGPIIEQFIPGITVTEGDFEAAEHIDILKFSGKDKKTVLAAVEIGLYALLQHFRFTQQRKEKNYVFKILGIVTKAVAHCNIVETCSKDEVTSPRAKYPRKYF